MLVAGFTVAVVMSFSTGEAFRPVGWACLVWGALTWLSTIPAAGRVGPILAGLVLLAATLLGLGPIVIGPEVGTIGAVIGGIVLAVSAVWPLRIMLKGLHL